MKYRVKPVIVGAIQWTGANVQEVVDFITQNLSREQSLKSVRFDYAVESTTVTVSTQDQVGAVMTAAIDDWIVWADGKISSVKPDVFTATYDPES